MNADKTKTIFLVVCAALTKLASKLSYPIQA